MARPVLAVRRGAMWGGDGGEDAVRADWARCSSGVAGGKRGCAAARRGAARAPAGAALPGRPAGARAAPAARRERRGHGARRRRRARPGQLCAARAPAQRRDRRSRHGPARARGRRRGPARRFARLLVRAGRAREPGLLRGAEPGVLPLAVSVLALPRARADAHRLPRRLSARRAAGLRPARDPVRVSAHGARLEARRPGAVPAERRLQPDGAGADALPGRRGSGGLGRAAPRSHHPHLRHARARRLEPDAADRLALRRAHQPLDRERQHREESRAARDLLAAEREPVAGPSLRGGRAEPGLAGGPVEAEPVFAAIRDRRPSDIPAVEATRRRLEPLLERLAARGVGREELVLVFDFVVSSDHSLTYEMLSMRDQAFRWLAEQVEDGVQTFTVDEVRPVNESCDPAGLPIWREVRGTFQAPLFLDSDPFGEPAKLPGFLQHDARGRPVWHSLTNAPYGIAIPCSARLEPKPVLVLGHGLFGNGPGAVTQLTQDPALRGFDFVAGGTNWSGLSSPDAANLFDSFIIRVIADVDRFAALPDRM